MKYIWIFKVVLRDLFGTLFFKNYIGQYSLRWANPSDIKKSLVFFPHSFMNFTFSDREQSRDKMTTLMKGFHVSSQAIQKNSIDIESVSNFSRAMLTFGSGIPPELTGEAFWYLTNAKNKFYFDGVNDYRSFKKRHESHILIYESIKSKMALRPRRELKVFNFREKGGINVVELASGEFVWAGGGLHRLAMAKSLNLRRIPVCVLLRDRKCLKNRKFTVLINSIARKSGFEFSEFF